MASFRKMMFFSLILSVLPISCTNDKAGKAFARKNTCFDTDQGMAYDEFGITYGAVNSRFVLLFNSCTDSLNQSCENCSDLLLENYCLGSTIMARQANCSQYNLTCAYGECG